MNMLQQTEKRVTWQKVKKDAGQQGRRRDDNDYVNPSYVKRDPFVWNYSFMCVTWLMWHRKAEQDTQSITKKWKMNVIRVCDVIHVVPKEGAGNVADTGNVPHSCHLFVWRYRVTSVTWLMYGCDETLRIPEGGAGNVADTDNVTCSCVVMTRSCIVFVWHDSFTRVMWRMC